MLISKLQDKGTQRMLMLHHLPRLVYSGEVGRRKLWRETLPQQQEGIYHLFDDFGDVVYIGKTCNPLQRFIRHKEKSWWWQYASHLNFYVLTCDEHPDEPCPRRTLERLAFRWEAHAIRDIRPGGNTIGVSA